MQLIISEGAKTRLFNESVLMDKTRGISARAFRKELKSALMNGNYEYDETEGKIYTDNFSYVIGKKYAEDTNGEPIPLHYTYNTVMNILRELF